MKQIYTNINKQLTHREIPDRIFQQPKPLEVSQEIVKIERFQDAYSEKEI
jgi:hypothetical protein